MLLLVHKDNAADTRGKRRGGVVIAKGCAVARLLTMPNLYLDSSYYTYDILCYRVKTNGKALLLCVHKV